jgi:hypothetical protein
VALNLSSLEGAVNPSGIAVSRSLDRELMGGLDEETRDVVRVGVIRNFEFTFELRWKFVERWIRINKTPEDAEPRTRKDLFRMTARYGLIEDPARGLVMQTRALSRLIHTRRKRLRPCVGSPCTA